MIMRYKQFLNFLDKKLEKMFIEQSPFIKCKAGCAYCCKQGEYPMSELEYVYLMFCYNDLDENIKSKVDENIQNLLKSPNEKMYQCPFLVDNLCSVYNSRAIICRTFGLINYDENNKKRIPFCVDLGLNYSDVYDENEQMITKCTKDNIEPLAYNINRKFLRNSKIENQFNIFFGEDKTLIEWLKEEFGHN